MFKFDMNGIEYTIKEVSNEEIKECNKKDFPSDDTTDTLFYGLTRHNVNEILLNKDCVLDRKVSTLKHELAHVFLANSGIAFDGKEYNEEEVCSIVSASNDFINTVVNNYFVYNNN